MVNWGKLELRHDTDYYLPRHYALLVRLSGSGHTIKKLYEVSRHIVDGPFGSAIKADDYVEFGVPFIRVADVTHGDGTLDTKDMIYISEEAHRGIKRSAAVPGDVVIAKTGATMGAASVVPPTIAEANIRGDLALVGKLGTWAVADYLSAFINTRIGYNLFWRLNSGSTRGRVVISNLKKLPVIWPEAAIRERIVQLVEEGRRQKNKRLAEADALLSSIDDYLLTELGIALPPEHDRKISNRLFATTMSHLAGWRFDPHALEPDVEACRESTSKYGHTLPLRRVVAFMHTTSNKRSDNRSYIGLENIQSKTGYLIKSDSENEFGTASVFEEGDVLFPKLRPYLNKVHYAETAGYCSTEFHVLRSTVLSNEFLARFLRSEIIVRQTKHLMTGNTLPRLQTKDIEKLLIPIPPEDAQRRICEEARRRELAAQKLRAEANAELEKAKAEIEAILLGDAA